MWHRWYLLVSRCPHTFDLRSLPAVPSLSSRCRRRAECLYSVQVTPAAPPSTRGGLWVRSEETNQQRRFLYLERLLRKQVDYGKEIRFNRFHGSETPPTRPLNPPGEFPEPPSGPKWSIIWIRSFRLNEVQTWPPKSCTWQERNQCFWLIDLLSASQLCPSVFF